MKKLIGLFIALSMVAGIVFADTRKIADEGGPIIHSPILITDEGGPIIHSPVLIADEGGPIIHVITKG